MFHLKYSVLTVSFDPEYPPRSHEFGGAKVIGSWEFCPHQWINPSVTEWTTERWGTGPSWKK